MPSNNFFSALWRRQSKDAAPISNQPTEATMNKPTTLASDSSATARGELLSYEDIYHAAGIMNPPSGYGIQKVVDMLNSERLRDLSKDVKRASVLMALEAAGTSIDDLQRDAVRRQQALESYETSQRKQLEEFEAHKTRENTQIEAEMERLKVHYAERIQRNHRQVEQEKTALHNWQMAMQHETQRIGEVIDLCQKTPAAAKSNPTSVGPAAASGEKAVATHA
jgi:hypothetical protein